MSERLAPRLCRALLRPIDLAWLAALRLLLGGVLGVSMLRFLVNGWVDELLLEPGFHFKYWGFGWIEPLPPAAMHALFWGLSGLALCVAAGLAFRLTAPLFALGFSYVQLIDVTNYLNHYYLAAALCWLLAISPAARAWSLDAAIARWRARRSGAAPFVPTATIPAAWQLLFRVQVGVVYVFAGLAKAQSDWLLHAQPLRIWLGGDTKLPLIGRLFLIDEVPLLMSWAGFLFDTTIVGWLLYRRTRPIAFLAVIVFHTATSLLFNIGVFPAIMIASALVFFSPSWPRRLFGWAVPASIEAARAGLAPPSLRQRLALGLAALYCLVQLTLPVRHLLYAGNVLWHEQGMRFSWRVMVRVKGGGTTFIVRQVATGKVWHVSPRDYLTPRQEAEMSSQPDLILQLAHHIEQDFAARGLGPVEVRAESHATLNGRRSARLIDPRVDLTTVNDGIAPATWILPAPSSAPPHTRPVL